MQQARERAGLPPLQTDPMLAYQANLDALLAQHMTTRRILATHVADAGEAARGSTSWLQDSSTTQVGIGVSPTDRGDSVVVILLGRSVTESRPTADGEARSPASAIRPTPDSVAQQSSLQPRKTAPLVGRSLRAIMPNGKLKLWHGFPDDDEPTPTPTSGDPGNASTNANPLSAKDDEDPE